MPSIVSQADAVIKMISAVPWLSDSQVVLEEMGFSEDQITRLLSDKRKAQANANIAAVLAQSQGASNEN